MLTNVTRRILLTGALAFGIGLIPSLSMAQDAALVKKGETVYGAQKCQVCHLAAGKGNKSNPLDGVAKKLSADDIRQWITHPKEAAAKAKSTKKPPMQDKYGALPAGDLDALVAYVQSLK